MTISIITPTFNSVSTIKDTLDSVLSQTYKDIDYVIVDGGSNDGTLEILKEYEALFEGRLHWRSEPDKGIYDAMNKGICQALGDVIGILNSDDFFHDERVLEDIAYAFEINSVECVYGNLEFVDEHKTNNVLRIWKGSQHHCGDFLTGWHPAHPTFYVKRKWYDKLGGFDTSLDVSSDFDLMLRFIEKAQIRNIYLDRYFVKMRMGGESTGSIRNIILGNRNVLKSIHKNGFVPSRFYLFKRLIPKLVSLIKWKLKLCNL